MSKQEQEAIKPDHWAKEIEKAESGNKQPIRWWRSIECRASDWRTCAAGEALADIDIHPDLRDHVVDGDPTLCCMGVNFMMHVERRDWKKAKHALRRIRNYVQAHAKTLKDPKRNTLKPRV